MELEFWILDVGQTVENGVSKVLMWGIDNNNVRVLVVDDIFQPYLYVLPDGGVDLGALAKSLGDLSIKEAPILGVEVVKRKLFGKSLDFLKVVFRNFDYTSKYVRAFKKCSGVKDCFEADIRHYMRYLADKRIRPCSWYCAEVQKVDTGKNVKYAVYRPLTDLNPVERLDLPNLRVMAFDIEIYSPSGALNPDKDPVIIISTATPSEKKQFVAEDSEDRGAIEGFLKYVTDFDPDVIVGFDSNFFDFPFLIGRTKRLRVGFPLGRDGSEPHPSVYGHISVAGRAHLDLYDMSETVVEIKVKTLKNIADYLGVMSKDSRVVIDYAQIPKYWTDRNLREQLLRYAAQEVESIRGVAEKLLPTAISMSQVSGMPLDQVMRAGVGFRVENMLITEAHQVGEIVPNKAEYGEGTYTGGYVLKPVSGIHDNIAVFDFASMYPNLMIKYNISPDTYVPPDESVSKDEVNVAPEVGHRFRKSPPGFYKKIIEGLIEERRKIQRSMEKLKPQTLQYIMMNERQKSIKTMTNAVYGYCGWLGAKWYLKPVAEGTSAWGREVIKETIKLTKQYGLEVIYADTDSVFVTNTDRVDDFSREVTQRLGLEIKPEKVYKRIFFTEAKKKYAGLLENGELDIVGFEVVRGDWPEIARTVQEEVLGIILREGDLGKAVEFVNETINRLREGAVSVEELVIWETITKPLDKYKVKAPHVVAAKKLIEAGGRLEVGSKIGYVIIKGEGSISDRAVPYSLADFSKVDVNYYIDRQIVSAALRVLEYFGVKESQFTAKPSRQLKLH